jgi:hypothetical protein
LDGFVGIDRIALLTQSPVDLGNRGEMDGINGNAVGKTNGFAVKPMVLRM